MVRTGRCRVTDLEREPRVPLGIAEVVGPSMVPTLRHGDQVLVHYGAPLRPGDVTVLRHPLQQDLLIVKRLIERREDGGWWVLGDSPAENALDSRVFGTVPEELVLGRVRGRYRPVEAGRRRSVGVVLGWLYQSVRPVLSDRDVSRRLRAR
ncbi:nickel-type superoxide dismutase maturation protease [Streptomyces beijiangensis]|uniref:Nickel-type superoxide dismutase maturation protease n=1 Tax=Streptomyces beijiangensis TaxID=163361 RepID=A0A939F460_9ACTN|nr:nickel-type superoxide dismutase maturation protease [Streptomyces beijiangensis]MBO0511945.1 nickel-type superoxide dismutase maturation protease [Streptomyces beijiangensis]